MDHFKKFLFLELVQENFLVLLFIIFFVQIGLMVIQLFLNLGKQGELSLVRETLNKVLFTMNKEKIKTVALSVFPKDYCSAYPLDVTVSMIWKTIYDWIQVNKKDSVIKNIQIVNEQEESLKLFMKEYENIVNPKKPVAKTEKVEKEEEEKKGVKRNFEQTEIKVDAMSISSTQPEDNMIMSSQSVDPVQSSTSNSLKNVVDSQPLFGTKKSKKVKKTYLGDSQPVFGKIEHSQMDQSQN